MAILGPFSIGYPVVFRSGGDTTRQAFGKHIQEIVKIYGILNALDNDKLSASDLDSKLAGFKPSMSFSEITGTLDMSRITGNLDISRITGNIPASRIYGTLSNANIAAGNVTGLEALVKGLIPAPSGGTGDGITDVNAEENGYAKFGNGFMLQWGKTKIPSTAASGTYTYKSCAVDINFPVAFSNKCLNVSITPCNSDAKYQPYMAFLSTPLITKSGCRCSFSPRDKEEIVITGVELCISYFAVGY